MRSLNYKVSLVLVLKTHASKKERTGETLWHRELVFQPAKPLAKGASLNHSSRCTSQTAVLVEVNSCPCTCVCACACVRVCVCAGSIVTHTLRIWMWDSWLDAFAQAEPAEHSAMLSPHTAHFLSRLRQARLKILDSVCSAPPIPE